MNRGQQKATCTRHKVPTQLVPRCQGAVPCRREACGMVVDPLGSGAWARLRSIIDSKGVSFVGTLSEQREGKGRGGKEKQSGLEAFVDVPKRTERGYRG